MSNATNVILDSATLQPLAELVKATLTQRKPRAPRASYQEGTIRLVKGKKADVWYLVYRLGEKNTSARLVEKDAKYHSKAAVRKLCAVQINRLLGAKSSGVLTIADYWATRFLPYCRTEYKQVGMKHSTIYGYLQIWNQHLAPHFSTRTLAEYTTADGNGFLRTLARKGLALNSARHVKQLATAIFNLAFLECEATDDTPATGLAVNPWVATKLRVSDFKATPATAHYTLEQSEDLVSALVGHADAQLVLALGCFLGMRPNEIAGLKWDDIQNGFIHIRRGIVRGVEGTPKTLSSVRDLPVLPQVAIPLALWNTECGRPSDGWVFPTSNGDPVRLDTMVDRYIKPHVMGVARCCKCNIVPKASGVKWRGLYAGRRGTATTFAGLGVDAVVVQKLLGHQNFATTDAFYLKDMEAKRFRAGMKVAEQKLLAASADTLSEQ